MGGYAGNILFIDLSKGTSWTEPIPQGMAKLFIGGKGFAIKILSDLIPKGADSLGPDNVIAICAGPLTGTMAPSMRGCIAAKSPLNQMFDDSYFGGHFSQEMKYAGYDAIVIRGSAAIPSYIAIDDSSIQIRSAEAIWGSDTYETYSHIRRDLGCESYKICCIGPAGENLVRYALVDCDPHRHAGRGGMGAVFGSKKLKGIAIRGSKGILVEREAEFLAAVDKALKELDASPSTRELAENSSVSLLAFSNEFGFLPVRNFQDGSSDEAEKLNSAAYGSSIWMRHWACAGCPIHCGKMGMLKRGPNKGTICDNVEYETVGLMGSNLAMYSPENTSVLNKMCDMLGLDTISTGNVIGFAFEAFEKGLISERVTDGVIFRFGDFEAVKWLIDSIARRRGIGDLLADGVERAAERISEEAKAFACSIQGMETPAWGPRGSEGMGLAYFSGDRGGCHQRGFPIAYETSGISPKGVTEDGRSVKGKGELVKWEQDMLAALYSLTICEFGRSGINLSTYIELLNATCGYCFTEEEFIRTGQAIWDMIRIFNVREGWNQNSVTLPQRFKEELPSGVMKGHKLSDENIRVLLNDYNRCRAWSAEGMITEECKITHGLGERITPLLNWSKGT